MGPLAEGSHSALGYAFAVATTKAIEIRTEIPGPRSRDLLTRGETAIAKPLQVYLPVFAAEALNATITDVDGNTFIDFAGGVGVVNVGHCHPRVVDAIQEQAARFVHTDFTVVPYASTSSLQSGSVSSRRSRARRARRSSTRERKRSRMPSRSRGSPRGALR